MWSFQRVLSHGVLLESLVTYGPFRESCYMESFWRVQLHVPCIGNPCTTQFCCSSQGRVPKCFLIRLRGFCCVQSKHMYRDTFTHWLIPSPSHTATGSDVLTIILTVVSKLSVCFGGGGGGGGVYSNLL